MDATALLDGITLVMQALSAGLLAIGAALSILEGLRGTFLAAVADGQAKVGDIAVGDAAAMGMIAKRTNDSDAMVLGLACTLRAFKLNTSFNQLFKCAHTSHRATRMDHEYSHLL